MTITEPNPERLSPEPPNPSQTRALSLDALRGLAILGMTFSGVEPWVGLPAWMYHGQEPPPSRTFNPAVSGITWVDLVFPFFLFSMGAAIPWAQKNRLETRSEWLRTLFRGLLLVAFAIFSQHVRPWELSNNPGVSQFAISFLGFLLALAMFGRFPRALPLWARVLVKSLGWTGAIVLLAFLRYPSDSMPRFSLDRSDIIILILAGASVLGTYAWRVTRSSFELRAALIAAIVAFRISGTVDGSWASAVWNWEPLPWLFRLGFGTYLLILLPGTIAGGLLMGSEPVKKDWALASACLLAVAAALVVFFTHANPMFAVAFGAIPLGLGYRRLGPKHQMILLWGFLWLTIGCLLEPYQGGIKKDPCTLSYLFATSGLASYALIGLTRLPSAPNRALASIGQNPLLGYQAMACLIPSLWGLALAPAFDRLPAGLLTELVGAVVKTVLLGFIVAGFTKARITMRV